MPKWYILWAHSSFMGDYTLGPKYILFGCMNPEGFCRADLGAPEDASDMTCSRRPVAFPSIARMIAFWGFGVRVLNSDVG